MELYSISFNCNGKESKTIMYIFTNASSSNRLFYISYICRSNIRVISLFLFYERRLRFYFYYFSKTTMGLYVESKIWHKLMRQKQNHGRREQTGGCWGRRGWRGTEWEFGFSRCNLLYIGCINKVLLYSTENYIQDTVTNYNGQEYLKTHTNTHSLCCTAVINTTL